MSHDDLLTIRQMCQSFGVTPRALRFYESRELISPLRRGQHRLYDRRDRGRLQLILMGKRFGFSLDEIRQLLELYVPGDGNQAQLIAAIELARRQLHTLQAQRDELAVAIADLNVQIAEAKARLVRKPQGDARGTAGTRTDGRADGDPGSRGNARTDGTSNGAANGTTDPNGTTDAGAAGRPAPALRRLGRTNPSQPSLPPGPAIGAETGAAPDLQSKDQP